MLPVVLLTLQTIPFFCRGGSRKPMHSILHVFMLLQRQRSNFSHQLHPCKPHLLEGREYWLSEVVREWRKISFFQSWELGRCLQKATWLALVKGWNQITWFLERWCCTACNTSGLEGIWSCAVLASAQERVKNIRYKSCLAIASHTPTHGNKSWLSVCKTGKRKIYRATLDSRLISRCRHMVLREQSLCNRRRPLSPTVRLLETCF